MSSQRRALMRVEVPFAALATALVTLTTVFAVTGIPSWIPPAPVVRLGVPSPLTGMTRSFVALASGDLRSAFAWHPLGPICFAACVALPLVAIVSWIRNGRIFPIARVFASRSLWLGVGILFAAAWIRQIAVLG